MVWRVPPLAAAGILVDAALDRVAMSNSGMVVVVPMQRLDRRSWRAHETQLSKAIRAGVTQIPQTAGMHSGHGIVQTEVDRYAGRPGAERRSCRKLNGRLAFSRREASREADGGHQGA